MYDVFESIQRIAERKPNLPIRLLYYEDEEEYEDEVDVTVALTDLADELEPLMEAHFHGNPSYLKIRDPELKRLKGLGPEGKAIATIWWGNEDIDEILLALADRVLEALADYFRASLS